MQTSGNSVDQIPVAISGDTNQKSESSKIPAHSQNSDVDAAYRLLSKQFIRKHLLMRTVSWTGWMLVIGVAFAAATVWLLFPS